MTAPSEFAGRTEFETENLRVRIAFPENLDLSNRMIMAQITIENKRDGLAYIDAKRSCAIRPQEGASNLLHADRVLPGGGFVKLGTAALPWGFEIGIVFAPRLTPIDEAALAKDSRRLLLSVGWDDGLRENLDFSYHFVRRNVRTPVSDSR